jgi:hypothetical protein
MVREHPVNLRARPSLRRREWYSATPCRPDMLTAGPSRLVPVTRTAEGPVKPPTQCTTVYNGSNPSPSRATTDRVALTARSV